MIYKIFTDGGSRGNPGQAACAFVVFKVENGAEILQDKRGKYLGTATNNEAEYYGVIEALSWLSANIGSDSSVAFRFCLDSSLVVNQLNGQFKVKENRLMNLVTMIRAKEQELKEKLPGISIDYSYVPREQNSEADRIVNETLDLL